MSPLARSTKSPTTTSANGISLSKDEPVLDVSAVPVEAWDAPSVAASVWGTLSVAALAWDAPSVAESS